MRTRWDHTACLQAAIINANRHKGPPISADVLNPYRRRQAMQKHHSDSMAAMKSANDMPRATQKVDPETLAKMRGESWPVKPT